jgi:hypothetical protein
MRAALYWAPALNDPLWDLGCAWLGRDAETGATCPQPPIDGISGFTAEPAQYGFHATLRPPLRVATGWDEFRAVAANIARATRPFALPPLEIAVIGGFLALRETMPCQPLQDFADRCVELTNAHRLQPSASELQRRRAAGLSPRQESNLQRWGYPYVMQDWFFHLTLTHKLSLSEQQTLLPHAQRHFAMALKSPRLVESLCIFTQLDGPFLIAERFSLGPP